jgi:hypothetical protein
VGYALAAWIHAAAASMWERGHDQRGQGTVEYVGMVVMVTLLVAAVAGMATGWADAVGDPLRKVITDSIKRVSRLGTS